MDNKKADAAPKRGRPFRKDKDNSTVPSTERWTKPGEKRRTYIVNSDLADEIDEIAHLERTTVKSVVNDAFIAHVEQYKKKHGAFKVPKKK